MPPVIAAVTAVATSSVFVGATAAIAVASTVASVVAMKKARKKVSGAQSQVERQQTLRSTTAPINRMYGKTRRAGLLVFAEEQAGSQAENEQLHLILELASHHCSRVSDIEIDKQKFDNFASHVRCTLYTGEQTTADPHIVANSQSWTDDCIGKDKTYAAVSLTADVDKFPHGIPNLTFLVEGTKVHDPRNPGMEETWSDNSALCILDFLRNEMLVPDDEINFDSFIRAANICDEFIVTADNKRERRYTTNGELSLDEAPIENLEKLLAACAGQLEMVGGKFYLRVGAYNGIPTLTITEDDIISDITLQSEHEQRQRVNQVHGTFVDASAGFVAVDYPPQTDTNALNMDGGEYKENLDLELVQSADQAQRLAMLHLRRKRAARVMRCRLKPHVGAAAHLGRNVIVKLKHLGLEQEFRVVDWSLDMKNGVEVTLHEEDISMYADSLTQHYERPRSVYSSHGTIESPKDVRYELQERAGILKNVISWEKWPTVSRYDLLIKDSSNAVITSITTPAPPIVLDELKNGEYTAELRAVALTGQRSQASVIEFVIAPPRMPTEILLDASVWDITLIPRIDNKAMPLGSAFEFEIKEGDAWRFLSRASMLTHTGRSPNTEYTYRIRTVTAAGVSDYQHVIVRTKENLEGLDTLVESRVTNSPLIKNLSTTVKSTADSHNNLWSVKTDVNDISAGIGLYNDGNGQTQCAINAQQFAVIDTNSGRTRTLFKVENGTTYLDNAYITTANIRGTLKADSIKANALIKSASIESSEINYKNGNPANDNFSLSKDGRLKCKNAEITGKIVGSEIRGGIMHSAYLISPHLVGSRSSVLSEYNQDKFGTMDLYRIVNVLKKEPYICRNTLKKTVFSSSYSNMNRDGLSHSANISDNFVSAYNDDNINNLNRFCKKRIKVRVAFTCQVKRFSFHNNCIATRLNLNFYSNGVTKTFFHSRLFIPSGISSNAWHYRDNGTIWAVTAVRNSARFSFVGDVTLDYSNDLSFAFSMNDRDTYGSGGLGFNIKISVDEEYNINESTKRIA